ncbi:hypothetical protein C8J56DRAFT_953390 [Mycena floridula]|nr:hypothetical protein C8J56DRAFT_953390 [Mycena floridula]
MTSLDSASDSLVAPTAPLYTIIQVKNTIKQLYTEGYDALDKTSGYQHFAFAPGTDLGKVVAKFKNMYNRHSLRISLDGSAGRGRIKTHMPSTSHEISVLGFQDEIKWSLAVIATLAGAQLLGPELTATGTATYTTNNISKEADASLVPDTRQPFHQSFPSVVFEVGMTQSLSSLKNNAAQWIAMHPGIRLVILIKLYKPSSRSINPRLMTKRVHLEFWDRNPATGAAQLSLTMHPNLQPIIWHDNNPNAVTTLLIPTNYLYDTVPAYIVTPTITIPLAQMQIWFAKVMNAL